MRLYANAPGYFPAERISGKKHLASRSEVLASGVIPSDPCPLVGDIFLGMSVGGHLSNGGHRSRTVLGAISGWRGRAIACDWGGGDGHGQVVQGWFWWRVVCVKRQCGLPSGGTFRRNNDTYLPTLLTSTLVEGEKMLPVVSGTQSGESSRDYIIAFLVRFDGSQARCSGTFEVRLPLTVLSLGTAASVSAVLAPTESSDSS